MPHHDVLVVAMRAGSGHVADVADTIHVHPALNKVVSTRSRTSRREPHTPVRSVSLVPNNRDWRPPRRGSDDRNPSQQSTSVQSNTNVSCSCSTSPSSVSTSGRSAAASPL